ncbi:MAG: penicillin acylase family protein [Caldilineaceae bacterium]
MRKLLRFFLYVIGLVVIVLLVSYLYLRQSLPQTTGTIQLSGLQGSVEIIRDKNGVPHIFATTDLDALYALGYVHAQDRMWQMEMNRRIGNGRLSEVLGDATLSIDKFQRTVGYARLVHQEYDLLEARTQQSLQAYAAGVNAWIAEGNLLPPEFLILGVKPEPWTVYDSLVWAKMMAWDLGGDYKLELLRAKLLAAVGPERAAQLLPDYPKDAVTILSEVQRSGSESAQSPNLQSPIFTLASSLLTLDTLFNSFTNGGREVGSNDWVIGGARTESGKPLLANDPHLGASIPSIWYLAEIQGDHLHATGTTFPGLPAVVIGHNEKIAWGVTNLNPDVQDLYVEKINPANPNQVEVNGQWQDMQISQEEIKVSGEDKPIQWAARWTRHGPLISDVSDTSTPVALRWTALDNDDTTIDAFVDINYAANWEDFRRAMSKFVGPSQNFVYADIEGNIGYFGPGHIPIRKQGNGYLPVPGWNDDYAWTGWIPFEELPQAYNPKAGFVATANNKVVPDDYRYFVSNDWSEPYRAERITELIESLSKDGEKMSPDDIATIQGDQKSTEVQRTLPLLLATANSEEDRQAGSPQTDRQKQALELLAGWDGKLAMDSAPASIYEAWVIKLTQAMFEDDLRGDLYEEMSTRPNPVFVLNVLNDPANSKVWCDNVLTPALESCQVTLLDALDKALDDLSERLGGNMQQWHWGKLHITQYPHRPFSEVSALKWLFHRTIANGGNGSTVNVAPSRISEPYLQVHVPSYRQIIDMSDLNASRFIITTGQSGNLLSPHYDDFIEPHRDVKYIPMTFGRDNVSGDQLTLQPK